MENTVVSLKMCHFGLEALLKAISLGIGLALAGKLTTASSSLRVQERSYFIVFSGLDSSHDDNKRHTVVRPG